MLTLEAKRMGFRVITLEPLPNSPCGQVADEQIVAAYDDLRAIGELGARSDVVTYEFENIPLVAVRALEDAHRVVRPTGEVLRVTQDRILEKTFLRANGVETADFAPVNEGDELAHAEETIGLPAVMKTTTGGYDGKGQVVIRSRAQAQTTLADARGRALIYERLIPFERELAVIAARNDADEIITFPVTETIHDHGVLSMTIVPARISPERAQDIREIAARIARALRIVGAFAVEFFDLGDEVLVNEIAPRVHNSGHYSLDGVQISQYEAHIRAICDLPLVEPRLLAPAVVMVNILGTGSGDRLEGLDEILREPDLKLHLYGKAHAALRRKMGHFTILAEDVDTALAVAERARKHLHWSRRSQGIAV
ncbi:MAG: 5-(carboxyamino)imidazole ribonucleotide synthase [Candidatus Eremiobacteraeota bacterium]|nr:5-(carboxyamino)imidazole ribonucleotide synthase [Candidatus Eremiobacteraeota bacterium]MBV8355847.1 5-(carboxyamino)imidazole ribonucleotide synthase [Candidatus Eremiobacteraeota bacterium]